MEPVPISVPDVRIRYRDIKWFCKNYPVCPSSTYLLLKNGSIKAKKLGRRTLIDMVSVEEYFASLPNYGEG